jgi:transcriptional regulator with XRE-family HTH domain
LKRARYLRRERGLNAAAIVEQLRQDGMLGRGAEAASHDGMGTRLRRLRQAKGKSLAAVAKAVGTSVGFISALERSQSSASVNTLRRIAKFYHVNILDFFDASARNTPLVRPEQRKSLQAGPGVRMELLAWGNTVMEPHLFRIAPGAGSGGAYSHHGEEFLYVLAGQFEISVQGKPYRLRSGDSFYFHSNTPHRWRNPAKRDALVLWVNTPPTF